MNRILWTAGLSAALGFAACGETTPSEVDPLDLGYDGTGIGVTIAPLDLPGIGDACYSFDIRNGAGERVVARGSAVGTLVSGQGGDGGPTVLAGGAPGFAPAGDPLPGTLSQPLCSTRFGNSQGAISYVAPCDASDGNQLHTIHLWVNSVCAGTSFGVGDDCTALDGFVNPCPGEQGCTVTAECVENADVPVTFNFTIMASAQQGFFDIAVNFDNVFCSAKLDSCYDVERVPCTEGNINDEDHPCYELPMGSTYALPGTGTPINLLFDSDGNRVQTAVAAVACSAGPGENTHLHMTTFRVNCGGSTYFLDFQEVPGEGNLNLPPVSAGIPLTGAIYYGTESLPGQSKVFTNVAFVLPTNAQGDGLPCSVEWFVVPSSLSTPPQPSNGSDGTFTQVAGVFFNPTQALVQAGTCHQHPLNEDGSGVTTGYTDGDHDLIPEGVIPYNGTLVIGGVDFNGVPGVTVECDHGAVMAALEDLSNQIAGTEDAMDALEGAVGSDCNADHSSAINAIADAIASYQDQLNAYIAANPQCVEDGMYTHQVNRVNALGGRLAAVNSTVEDCPECTTASDCGSPSTDWQCCLNQCVPSGDICDG